MTYLSSEIAEQPDVIERLITEQADNAREIGAAIRAFNPAFVTIAARGTSDNAGRYAQYLFGIQAGLSVGLSAPSIHTIYGNQTNLSRALVIGISQSGQSEDVRQVVADARARGVEVDGVLAGELLDLGVLAQVLRRLVLDVVVDGEDGLARIVDLRRADLLELGDHGGGVVMGHHVPGTDGHEIAGAHGLPGLEAHGVAGGDLLDEGQRRFGHGPASYRERGGSRDAAEIS